MGALKLCAVLLFCVLQYHGSAAICEDKYEQCGKMAAAGGCQEEGQWGAFVSGSCPKSCGDCGEVRYLSHYVDARLAATGCTKTSTDDCKDCCEECEQWKEEGLCEKPYILEKCPYTCHVPRCFCEDDCPEACQEWADDNMCNIDWIDEHCPIACKWPNCTSTTAPPTTPVPTTPVPTTPKPTTPKPTTPKPTTPKPTTPKPTTPKPTTPKPTTPKPTTPKPTTPKPTTTPVDCTDECIPACQEWYADKSWDMCAHPRFAKVCPAECDPRCKDPHPITTHVPPPPGSCTDLCTDSMGQFMIPGAPTKWCHCSNWIGYVKDCPDCDKNQGHPLCEKYGKLVFDDSTRQCDWPEIACKSRSDCPYTVLGQVQKREYADCEQWAANGDCHATDCGTCDWQKWVARNCPVACANNAVAVKAQKREYADCALWAAGGQCYDPARHTQWACGTCDWEIWVAKNCPVACANNAVAVKVEKREYADCVFWAANGDCHTTDCGTCDWQKWVIANCPVACANAPDPVPVPVQHCDDLCTDSMGQFMIWGVCNKWCHCSNWLGYIKDCPVDSFFNPATGRCDLTSRSDRSDC